MLEKLLDEIRNGGTQQPAALAARLNISVGMVQAMLENLERMGLLSALPAGCGETCGGCPLSDACGTNSHSPGRIWAWNGAQKIN